MPWNSLDSEAARPAYMRLAEVITSLIEEITETIERLVDQSPKARLLMTVPGISYYSALLILSEIGEVERFPSATHLCSYAGLVPGIYSSGSKSFHGRITKQGSRWLQLAKTSKEDVRQLDTLLPTIPPL